MTLDATDRRILKATASGLPLTPPAVPGLSQTPSPDAVEAAQATAAPAA